MAESYTAIKSAIKRTQSHYKMMPKIVRSNARADFRIVPLYDRLKFGSGDYQIVMCPVMQIAQEKKIVIETRGR